jgi:hypothetical protein
MGRGERCTVGTERRHTYSIRNTPLIIFLEVNPFSSLLVNSFLFLSPSIVATELPRTDNIGALFMFQNSLTGVTTRHVNTRYHFIRENIKDGICIIT